LEMKEIDLVVVGGGNVALRKAQGLGSAAIP
jgi:siroheme synthase (precorrin-2 oxidase/ferrochelatase)